MATETATAQGRQWKARLWTWHWVLIHLLAGPGSMWVPALPKDKMIRKAQHFDIKATRRHSGRVDQSRSSPRETYYTAESGRGIHRNESFSITLSKNANSVLIPAHTGKAGGQEGPSSPGSANSISAFQSLLTLVTLAAVSRPAK